MDILGLTCCDHLPLTILCSLKMGSLIKLLRHALLVTFTLATFDRLFIWQLILFGEIVLAQKIMYEKFGDDFLLNFLSKGFMNTHCPQHLVEQYCQKLQVRNLLQYY